VLAALETAIEIDSPIVSEIARTCPTDILLSYALARLADDNYVFRASFRAVFLELAQPLPTFVWELFKAAIEYKRWLALRQLIKIVAIRRHPTSIILLCMQVNAPPDTLNWIYEYLNQMEPNSVDPNIVHRMPSAEHIFAIMENWESVLVQDALGCFDITNEQRITNGRYRRAVSRCYAIIVCYEDGLLTTNDQALLCFLQLMKRLPIDVQQVVANRVYGCNRDIVPVMEDDESLYWVLRLGPKYGPL